MDLPTLASLLTAVGVSGLVVNWVAEGKARRHFRGDVLKLLSEAESKRWAGQHHSYREFETALYDLQTAALVARVPQHAVHQYVVLAEVARRVSDDSFAFYNGDFDAGASEIDRQFATHVRDSAGIISQLAWHPVKKRFRLARDLKKIRTKLSTVHDRDVRMHLAISQRVHGTLPGALAELPLLHPILECPEATNDEELFGKTTDKSPDEDGT